jgi:hypothetical protein
MSNHNNVAKTADVDGDDVSVGDDDTGDAELSGDQLAGNICDDVGKLLTQSRDSHGDAVENQEHIAEAWNWYLQGRLNASLTGTDVARMMQLLKISRAVVGHGYQLDHDRDTVGYGAIAAACSVSRGVAGKSDALNHRQEQEQEQEQQQRQEAE